VNTVVSLGYYARVLGPAYFAGEPARTAGTTAATEDAMPLLGFWAAAGVAVSVAGIVVLGIWVDPLMAAFRVSRLLPG